MRQNKASKLTNNLTQFKLNSPNSKLKFNLENFLRIASILIIFLSIIPYASSYVWMEAAVCAAIFVLSVYICFTKKIPVGKTKETRLLLPLLGLAFYSFLQGIFTISENETSAFFPYSYDLTASFWSAVKILAFAAFIKLLLDNFRRNIKFLVWGLLATGNIFALIGIFRFVIQNRFPDTFQLFYFSAINAEYRIRNIYQSKPFRIPDANDNRTQHLSALVGKIKQTTNIFIVGL